jgi:ABC-type phosphate/phosphonate transport system substrate-binding protein
MFVALLAVAAFLTDTPTARADEKKDDRLRIALVESLLRDSPAAMVKPVVEAFGTLVQTQTGLEAEVMRGEDACRLGRRICDNDVQLGIFQGVEYAWAKQKCPELKPLMVIINHRPRRHGALVVRADSPIANFTDLKGKAVAMPQHSRCHCELFLSHGLGDAAPKDFFRDFGRPSNAEDALDDLVDGRYEAVIVDVVALDAYQRRKPARANRLKVACKSEPFPASVVAYRPGNIDAKRLRQLQDGLMHSGDTVIGRHLMMLCRMSAFDRVPADFNTQLEQILKSYPAPKDAR